MAARNCADTQQAAFAGLPGLIRAKAMDTKLLTVYQHMDWKGSSDSFTGDAGPCDSEGYEITTSTANDFVVGGISSYTTFNNCNGSRTYFWNNEIDHCVDGYGDVRYVGDECNDHVYSMRVYRLF